MATSGTKGIGRLARDGLPLVPFFAFILIFLIIPTIGVLWGAINDEGTITFDKITALGSSAALDALWTSILLSASTAVIGAVAGALLCWLIVASPPDSIFRRVVTSLMSVLAQFGGVALAFAFIATISISGVVTLWVDAHLGLDLYGSGWLYGLPGLILVYSYFQIPLMVIVFLPALDGLKPQWREAATSLGATGLQYWTRVGFPLLAPAFLGSTLLLFANAFAAYATAAALVSQGAPILPLLVRSALTSEVVLGQAGFGYALALEMIVVVTIVMVAYTLLVRRTSRWLQ